MQPPYHPSSHYILRTATEQASGPELSSMQLAGKPDPTTVAARQGEEDFLLNCVCSNLSAAALCTLLFRSVRYYVT